MIRVVWDIASHPRTPSFRRDVPGTRAGVLGRPLGLEKYSKRLRDRSYVILSTSPKDARGVTF